jgi:hypothetical protein
MAHAMGDPRDLDLLIMQKRDEVGKAWVDGDV